MARRKRSMGLTECEREFLALYVRTDREADHLAAYRTCKCAGHDGTDKAVAKRIDGLVVRPDARLVMAQERQRRRILIAKEMAQADTDRAAELISDEEGRRLAKQTLVLEMLDEAERLRADPKRSLQGLAKSFGEYMKATAGADGEENMTAEEAAAALAELRRLKDEDRGERVPVKQGTVDDALLVIPGGDA